MAGARKCDACGKFYEVYNIVENRKKPSGIRLLNIDHEGKFYQHEPIDLCPDCMNSIMYILNQKKEEE